MANFKLEDYEPVESRIKRFYADHEDGSITTDLISPANAIETTVVKAFVYVAGELRATGLAYEQAGQGYVNKTSHLENCETSAIGRALANFNYSGDLRPSREEMQKTQAVLTSNAEPANYSTMDIQDIPKPAVTEAIRQAIAQVAKAEDEAVADGYRHEANAIRQMDDEAKKDAAYRGLLKNIREYLAKPEQDAQAAKEQGPSDEELF